MSIKKKLVKGAAYATHPKGTFALLNPKKALIAKAMDMAINRVTGKPRRPSRAAQAARGLGAAAVMLPVGFWIARRLERDRSPVAAA